MANLTQIYVSTDGVNFNLLELAKNEPIVIKLTNKDLTDLSKVFSPYSQSFTVPATPQNRLNLEFFGDTEVLKSVQDKLYFCKLYTDDLLYMTGKLKVTGLVYKNNKPIDFTVNFTTTMSSLKDKIGDDTINKLSDRYLVNWGFNDVYTSLKSIKEKDGLKYFVPLMSNSRVWSVQSEPEAVILDNIAFDNTVNLNSNNFILANELRPVVDFASIIRLIIEKYNLDVSLPIEDKEEYKDLFVLCNNSTIVSTDFKKITIINNLGAVNYSSGLAIVPSPARYVTTSNLADSSFKAVRNNAANSNYGKFLLVALELTNVQNTTSENTKMYINIVRKSDNEIIATDSFDSDSSNKINAQIKISDGYFNLDNELEFYIFVKFDSPTVWKNCKFGFFNSYKGVYAFNQSVTNNNSNAYGGAKLNLIASLPETPVIEFLTSFYKMFNISVYDTNPDDDKLYWLTPLDIATNGLVYSRALLDYTDYVDISDVKKSIPNDYNYYNFKLQDSDYKSNNDYLAGAGQEYGQLTYPTPKPNNANEFKVELDYSIIPPVVLTDDIATFYGFNTDSPETLSTGETRYNPNFNELTFFYSHGVVALGNNALNFKNQNGLGALLNSKLDFYIKTMPWTKISKQSLSFSILVYNNIQYPVNLYSQYYDIQTERFLDPNTLAHEFDLILPSSELYLNEGATIQGAGLTPSGFRLQNDIIIGETRFSIVDAQIDRTTGKTKLTLLNY